MKWITPRPKGPAIPEYGITQSSRQLKRAEEDGKWPRRVPLYPGASQKGWPSSVIEHHLARLAELSESAGDEGTRDQGILDPDSGEALERFQATDNAREFRYKSGISGKQPLRFEKVNEVTLKLTDGELTNVPRSHGQWGGYRTTKAVGWVICIVSGQWLARCGDRACGPDTCERAKRDALAMARGAIGHYCVRNPVDHLNGLAARLIDRGVKP